MMDSPPLEGCWVAPRTRELTSIINGSLYFKQPTVQGEQLKNYDHQLGASGNYCHPVDAFQNSLQKKAGTTEPGSRIAKPLEAGCQSGCPT
jgi:hypothetical protein